jgi:hypothetical protein
MGTQEQKPVKVEITAGEPRSFGWIFSPMRQAVHDLLFIDSACAILHGFCFPLELSQVTFIM